MILTKKEILKEIKKGGIKITGFNSKYLGPASCDLALSNEFRVFKDIHVSKELSEQTDYKKMTRLVRKNELVIMPGESVLGITKERIKLAPDICGWLQGRSRFARMGLMVHITASFMQPGIENKQVLEMFNASPMPLKIKAGTRVCQFIFERCEGGAVYKGKFKKQKL